MASVHPTTVIQGCIIGTNTANETTFGNGITGIHIENGASSNLIGGTSDGQGNVIVVSRSAANGAIQIQGVGTNDNTVLGNLIGLATDGTPLQSIENLGSGIVIEGGAQNNTIGGSVAGAGNTISHNVGNGVEIRRRGHHRKCRLRQLHRHQREYATGNDSSPDLIFDEYGNKASGIYIHNNASNNTIGGTGTGAGNYIWNNLKYGIEVDGSTTITATSSGATA